jgi:hypothetical protein
LSRTTFTTFGSKNSPADPIGCAAVAIEACVRAARTVGDAANERRIDERLVPLHVHDDLGFAEAQC